MPSLPHRVYVRLSIRWARWRFARWCSRIAKLECVPVDYIVSPASRLRKSRSSLLICDRLIATINQLPDEQYVLLALHMRGLTSRQLAARRGITEEEALSNLSDVIHQLINEGIVVTDANGD